MEYIATAEVRIDHERFRQGLGEESKKAEQAFNDLVESIKRFGQLQPIVLDQDNNLVAGFRRYSACKHLGQDVGFVRLEELSEIARREIELEENIRRLDMTWQERNKAIVELHRLRSLQNPNQTGTTTATELGITQPTVAKASMVMKAAEVFPEILNAPNLKQALRLATLKSKQLMRTAEAKKEVSKDGTSTNFEERLATIYNGSAKEYLPMIPSESVSLVLSDPPWGVGADQTQQAETGLHSSAVFDDSPDVYHEILSYAPGELYRICKPEAHVIWFFGPEHYQRTIDAFREAGFQHDWVPLVWDRSDGPVNTRFPEYWFRRGAAFALHFRKGNAIIPNRSTRDSNVLRFPPAPRGEKEFFNEHPVELYIELIRRLTVEGETVLDPFLGSGSVCAAAAAKRRRFYGIELDPARWAYAREKVRAHLQAE